MWLGAAAAWCGGGVSVSRSRLVDVLSRHLAALAVRSREAGVDPKVAGPMVEEVRRGDAG